MEVGAVGNDVLFSILWVRCSRSSLSFQILSVKPEWRLATQGDAVQRIMAQAKRHGYYQPDGRSPWSLTPKGKTMRLLIRILLLHHR